MYAKKLKSALSLTLAIIMAAAMFACCAFSVSAEDATEATFVPFKGYTWAPMLDVTYAKGTTTTETVVKENVPLEEAQALAALTGNATKTIETVDNGDGTVTGNKVTTTHTYVANDDGETATVTTTIKKEPHTFVNPLDENADFKFGIYSDRDDKTRGVWYATDYQAFQIYASGYGGNVGTAGNKHSNTQHKINVIPDETNHIENVTRSFYSTETQTAGMENVVIFGIRQYNELYLEFTAPSAGVYTASGIVSKIQNTNAAVADGVVEFYLAKVDENGVEHAVSEIANLPDHITNTANVPDVKVELKAGEKLVLRTDNDVNFVGKVFVKDYIVTKWDYSEAEDKSTVTTNYGYQNHSVFNVYGANYSIGDSNYETLWTVRAAKFQNELDELDATTPTREFGILKNNAVYANGQPFGAPATGGSQNAGIWYDTTTGSHTAKLYWGVPSNATATYRNGLQFTFTMPEDGSVVLTGASKASGDNTIARVGIKKKDSDEVVYGLYYVKGGTAYNDKVTGVRGVWSQLRYAGTTNYREHNLGELEAGDVIYYEMCMFDGAGQKAHDLSTLNVAITTSNSVADFNGDFKADATDVTYLRRVLLRAVDPVDRLMFNITEDEVVNLRDLVRIKKLLSEDVVEDTTDEPVVEDATTETA